MSITVVDQEGEAAAVPPPTNKAPKADAQELETASGTPLLITLTGSDKETCDLDFTIVDGPANGALSVVSDAGCIAGHPTNTDSATSTYTPNDGFTREDRFTFLVNDGQEDSEPAAVSITVEANSVEPAAVPPPTNKAPKSGTRKSWRPPAAPRC